MAKIVLEDDADYIVIGTGAGGATAARVLTEAGHSVVLLEEGEWLNRKPSSPPPTMIDSFKATFRGLGSMATAGNAPIPILQGRCVGGSTTINCGILWRMPEDVRQVWRKKFGLGDLIEETRIERIFDTLESEMQAAVTHEDLWGGNGSLMHQACKELSLPGKAMTRAAATCKGSAQCNLGCPNKARQSMETSYVPRAMQSGARLYTGAKAERVREQNGRAREVIGRTKEGKFRIVARKGIVIACGAIHTPILLRRSGIRKMVGERFQAHPGAAVVGRFPSPVTMGQGATQAFEVPMRERRFKLESLSVPAEMLASRVPGVGSYWQERVSELNHFAQWATLMRMHSMGTVREGFRGEPNVRFKPTAKDMDIATESVALLCRMMFAAGAIEVYPGIIGQPEVLTDISQVKAIEEKPLKNGDVHMIASHLFGTACASEDTLHSVVGPDLQCHDLPGLYVADASVFPTNLGVNPQHSIQAVVWSAMERIAA